MSYVLRRDSWSDEEGLYQRILLRKKISNMRKYLTTAKRVFVNNIIVTLPQETKLNDPKLHAKNLDPKLLTKVENVSISVPYQTDAIGIIDGQHRVFCYHEGADKYESEIKKLRGRQNLLVTGIVFPSAYNDQRQREFAVNSFLKSTTRRHAQNPVLSKVSSSF